MPRAEDPTAAPLRGINTYWQQMTADDIAHRRHREIVGGYWDEIGALQLHVLQRHGLSPEHLLLDVGCGALRGGVHFVRYLQPGHYCGVDANTSLIEAGRRELEAAGLADRGVRLVAEGGFGLDVFECRFDYVMAWSLFTHLYLNHIQIALCRIRAVLAPGGRLFATFFEAPTAAHTDPIDGPGGVTHYDSDLFHQAFDELATMGRRAGLYAVPIGDFGHPRGQQLVMFDHGDVPR